MTEDQYAQAVAQAGASRAHERREIIDRAHLVIQMLSSDNAAARAQAVAAVERGFRAEFILGMIRDLPSRNALLNEATARAMWELAGRID